MTTIFTRDDLRKMYTKNVVKIHENKIQAYVTFIQERILNSNDHGDKMYSYYFHKSCNSNHEPPEIGEEIARRLQNIFVDSEINYHKENAYNESYISIHWSM